MEVKSFKIDSNEYKLQAMSPDRAVEYCTDVAVTLAPVLSSLEISEGMSDVVMQLIPNIGKVNSERLKPLMKVVREYMVLPNGNLASHEFSYHDWFSKHPSDLMTAHLKGMFILMKDFFPRELGTILGGLNLA